MEIVSQEDTNFELHRAEVDTAVQVRGRGREGGTDRRIGREGRIKGVYEDIILFLVQAVTEKVEAASQTDW